MNVAFVVNYFHNKDRMNFGPFPLIYNVVSNFSRNNNATVLSPGWPKYPRVGAVDGINVWRVPTVPFVPSYLYLNYYSIGFFGFSSIVRLRPDIVNSQDICGSVLFERLSRRNVPVHKIVSLKGSPYGWFERMPSIVMDKKAKYNLNIQKYYEKKCVVNSDKIIVPSNFLRNELLRFYSVSEDKIVRIYNGVNLSVFYPMEMKNKVKDDFVLFFTGGDSYRKGTDILISAFIQLKERYKNIKLIVSGTLSMNRFSDTFLKNGIVMGEDIIFKGRIPYLEMPRYYNMCDVFIMPSYHETFCSAVAEAMACGKPVVATNDTAMPEVVGDCGFLVDPGDVDGFVDAISKLLDDAALRRKMGQRARRRAEKHFSLDRVIKDYLRLFRALV